MAKGTTTESGLVSTYFANVFGPSQYKDLHDELVKKYFNAIFASSIPVHQIRTQLGVKGFEKNGPMQAAKALLDKITN